MAFTSYFKFEKAAYRTIRYDEPINSNYDLLEAALLGFPGSDPPGSATNYPDVVPYTGMRWVDTGNDQERVYYNGAWQIVKQFS